MNQVLFLLTFSLDYFMFSSLFIIELLFMVHDKLKSDHNYLTGSLPSEVMKLPSFDPLYVGEFMLRPFIFLMS
jgi:hypothetical protein